MKTYPPVGGGLAMGRGAPPCSPRLFPPHLMGTPPAQQPPSCYAASPPHRPRPSFLFSIKNWKEESWKRAKRGGPWMHLSSYGERDADGYGGGGVPKRRGGVCLTEGGGGIGHLCDLSHPPLSLSSFILIFSPPEEKTCLF
nr:hypothetical protein [Morchella crassipes]